MHDPTDHETVLRQVGQRLVDYAPAGWIELRFKMSALVGISAASFEARAAGGVMTRLNPPSTVWRSLTRLRTEMYQPERGTWMSVEFVVEASGRYYVDFDYDNPPSFDVSPVAETYVLELEHHPRDPANIPTWLAEELSPRESP